MKIELKYLLFVILSFSLKAQKIELFLQKAECKVWNGNIYAYGLSVNSKNVFCVIYKLSPQLAKTDSLQIDLGRANADDFLKINADTLHDFLNIYVQKKEKKLVQIIRLNKSFKLIASVENVDVARLNSIAAFESEIFYSEQNVYTVKASYSDTSGRQFYLNKYSLKSQLQNFEYDFTWQFPFEKRNINSAHIISVNKNNVLLYVNVLEGIKRGQWLLRVDAVKGSLIRGTKINPKGDQSFYTFGSIYTDSVNKEVYVTGQKFLISELDQKENKINILNKPFAALYLTKMDSLGEIISRDEFKIPIIEPKGNKTATSYIFRTEKLSKTKDGLFIIENDIFKGTPPCYRYCNSISNTVTLMEEKLIIDKGAISSNTLIEKFYFNEDKADMNGKLCADSLNNFEKLYYRTLPFKIKMAFKFDETGSPAWLLKKSDSKKGMEDYSYLSKVNKVFQLTKTHEILKQEQPGIFILSKTKYLISRQKSEDVFEINTYLW